LGIVPMHEWKMPLKYWSMLSSLSGPLGLGRAADTMAMVRGGGTYEVAGTKIYEHIHTEFSVAAMVAGSNNGLPWRRAGRQWRFAAHFDCYLIL